MTRPPISHRKLSETLELSECHNGWWLWDETRGMNLSMKAKTPEEAFVEALTYYQMRLAQVERNYQQINERVCAFVEQFQESDED